MIFVRLYMDRHLAHLHSFPLMESHIYIYVACILNAYSFHRVSRETYTFGRDSFYLIEYLWMLIINSVFFNIFLRFVFSIYSFIKYFQLCISEILLCFNLVYFVIQISKQCLKYFNVIWNPFLFEIVVLYYKYLCVFEILFFL